MTNEEKLITFVVPCYNSQAYMRKCVDSLLPAEKHCQIIIVDDGSTDETGAIADAYAEAHPDCIEVVHQPNGGHGEGINSGLARARGRYFKVVDSDDWADLNALNQVVDTLLSLEKEGGVDLMICNYVCQCLAPRSCSHLGGHQGLPYHPAAFPPFLHLPH